MSRCKGKILIVDDDRDFRGAISAILTAGGYRPIEEADAGNAMHSITEYDPDLVLMDLSMPGSLGIDLVRRMKNEAMDTPVVILSGGVEEDQRKMLNELGVGSVLAKPVSMTDLLDSIGQVLLNFA